VIFLGLHADHKPQRHGTISKSIMNMLLH
jgi:hypothetical protein